MRGNDTIIDLLTSAKLAAEQQSDTLLAYLISMAIVHARENSEAQRVKKTG